MARKLNLMGSGISAQAAEHIVGAVSSGLTATGSTQADALLLQTTINEVTNTASGTGVILLSGCSPGDEFFIYNIGAQTLTVYAPGSETINAIAAASGFSVATAKTVILKKVSATRWATLLTA